MTLSVLAYAPGGNNIGSAFAWFDSAEGFIGAQSVTAPTLLTTLAAGTYFLDIVEFSADPAATYTVRIATDAAAVVPLPAGLPLLLGGLGGLALLRRRARS